MSPWWDRIGDSDPAETPQAGPRASVYERRDPSPPDGGERWEPVGEIDPQTGAWAVLPRPGWERRAQGWASLNELLGSDEVGW